MAKRGSIFTKARLRPTQLRSVADHRLGDARCLLESGDNARLTGAMYMGGFVIECLLKAILLERHPNLGVAVDPTSLSRSDREVLALLYGHELDVMLQFLPDVRFKLLADAGTVGRPLWTKFQYVCEEWTIFARYSPRHAKRSDAERSISTIEEVRQWLKEL